MSYVITPALKAVHIDVYNVKLEIILAYAVVAFCFDVRGSCTHILELSKYIADNGRFAFGMNESFQNKRSQAQHQRPSSGRILRFVQTRQ